MIQWQSPSRNSLWQTISAKYSNRRLTAIARMLWTNCWDDNDKSHNHENRIMPSVSLSYNILPQGQLMARMFWKSSLRMPTFNELYYYHIGSTDLKPERSSQWNIGLVSDTHITSSIGSIRIAATIDGYISNVDDKIIAIPFNMFVWRMMNLAKVRTLGIDATSNIAWTINPRHTLLLSANYTLQKAQNRSNPQSPYYNNQIAYTPVNTFATSLAWQNPWADIAATIDGMSNGGQLTSIVVVLASPVLQRWTSTSVAVSISARLISKPQPRCSTSPISNTTLWLTTPCQAEAGE